MSYSGSFEDDFDDESFEDDFDTDAEADSPKALHKSTVSYDSDGFDTDDDTPKKAPPKIQKLNTIAATKNIARKVSATTKKKLMSVVTKLKTPRIQSQQSLTRHETDLMLAYADEDGDDMLDEQELAALFKNILPDDDPHKLRAMAKKFIATTDVDGDGKITLDECMVASRSIAPRINDALVDAFGFAKDESLVRRKKVLRNSVQNLIATSKLKKSNDVAKQTPNVWSNAEGLGAAPAPAPNANPNAEGLDNRIARLEGELGAARQTKEGRLATAATSILTHFGNDLFAAHEYVTKIHLSKNGGALLQHSAPSLLPSGYSFAAALQERFRELDVRHNCDKS